MGAYIAERFGCDLVEAHRIQKGYFHGHGTTLAGLMAEHDVDPHRYLADVHDIEMDVLEENLPLDRRAWRGCRGARSSSPMATRLMPAACSTGSVSARPSRRSTTSTPPNIGPSPSRESAYAGLCDAFGLDPAESLFVEDMARNLKPAKAIGMTTVWVDNGSEQTPTMDRSFIDFRHRSRHWLHEILEDDDRPAAAPSTPPGTRAKSPPAPGRRARRRRDGARPARFAARRASPNPTAMAAGASISGSRKAVLLSFRLNDNALIDGGPGGAAGSTRCRQVRRLGRGRFRKAGFRACPGASSATARFIAKGAMLMPSFVNIGAYVGEGTMVDTWATVGSCAQIGKNVHLSGGVGIGGVLEPLQADPVIIGDGASSARAPKWPRASASAKARCCRWASISAPRPRSSTARPAKFSRRCAALFGGRARQHRRRRRQARALLRGDRQAVDAQTRAKTGINELLRD
jgi:putative hydrolase of the HAD superfamily